MTQNKKKKKDHAKLDASKPPSTKGSIVGAGKKLFKLTITLIGIYASLIAFYPFISVKPGETMNKKNPLETRFSTANQSPIPIFNITYKSELIEGDIKATPSMRKAVFIALNFSSINKVEPYTEYSMRMDYRQTERIANFRKPIIQIWVEYSLPLVPFYRFKKGFQFFALQNTNNEYVWFPHGPGKTFLNKDQRPFIID